MFSLAKARDLDLDFHVDENPNEEAKGLRYVALKTIEHGYQGRVVCGHCWCATGFSCFNISGFWPCNCRPPPHQMSALELNRMGRAA